MVKYFVKCINQHGSAHLTLGREYEQKLYKQDSGSVTVTNDNGDDFTYPSCLFGVSHVEHVSHLHASIIREWANGAIIQCRFDGQVTWRECDDNHPKWLRNYHYRVKPTLDDAAISELIDDIAMYEKAISKHRTVITLHNRYLTKAADKLNDTRHRLKSLEDGGTP